MSIQSTIAGVLPTLTPSARRIAEVVRANPALVLDTTIGELAKRCATSEASVVRFCRTIGLSGYAQLKIGLASELGREEARFGESVAYGADIVQGDSLRELALTISALEMLAIHDTIEHLDFAAVAEVVDALDGADRTVLFGVGASHFVAEDLQHKLFRIGRTAFVLGDAHSARAAAVLLTPRSVAIGFSHAGETAETADFLRLARSAGAVSVAVTSASGSRVARAASIALLTEVRESPLRAGAMVSRMAQLAVVDCVFAGVAQRRFADTVDALKRTREATRAVVNE
jgi:DNA-binding MurR/RpiR family transcriptional regulator